MTHALVFGGTGTIGQEVLKGLAHANISTTFTYYQSENLAQELAKKLSQQAMPLNLEKPATIRSFFQELKDQKKHPTLFIHCAAKNYNHSLDQITDAKWLQLQTINCHSAFIACQELAPFLVQEKKGAIILLGALNRVQSFKLPVHFAATQGMLSAMTMALAKELGPKGILINMISSGLLNEGLSKTLDPKLMEDYKNFSALKREGTPQEIAKAILWLALKNTYINGQVLSINGGI